MFHCRCRIDPHCPPEPPGGFPELPGIGKYEDTDLYKDFLKFIFFVRQIKWWYPQFLNPWKLIKMYHFRNNKMSRFWKYYFQNLFQTFLGGFCRISSFTLFQCPGHLCWHVYLTLELCSLFLSYIYIYIWYIHTYIKIEYNNIYHNIIEQL